MPTQALDDVSAVKYFGQATLDKYPELRGWKLPPPSSINSENLITRAGIYNPLRNVQLISAYPIVQGYKSTAGVGMRAEFADRLRSWALTSTRASRPIRFCLPMNAHMLRLRPTCGIGS